VEGEISVGGFMELGPRIDGSGINC